MARENTAYVLAERPKGNIVHGKTFRAEKTPAPTADDLKDGEMLVEALYLSLDPAMRGYLNDARSYMPPVQIGERMRGLAISRVLASKSDRAQPGDLVNAPTGWAEMAIVNEKQIDKVELPPNARVTDSIGVLGLTGLTAFFGLDKIGQPGAGDTVVVSGAAGATGSVVGQIARLRGAKRVIGIAGSEDKCRWLTEELGFDVALNYKEPDLAARLKAATPDFIDVFWDNVGGEILELALNRAAKDARFVMCGSISGYNSRGLDASAPTGIRNLHQVVAQRIRMQGFIIFDFLAEFARGRAQLASWLNEGKIQRRETIVPGGIGEVENAFDKLFDGSNIGKLLLEIKPYDAADNTKKNPSKL